MERGELFDGNPYISDGDLLSTTGRSVPATTCCGPTT